MKLYSYWRSSSAWRIRIALHWKGLPFEYVPVHLVEEGGQQFKPEHRARNPMAQVPVLEWEEGGVVRHLAQSMAILEWLEETHPERPLLPKEPWARAQARMLAEHCNSGIQPLHNQAVLKKAKELAPDGDKLWGKYWLDRLLPQLEAAAARSAGRYCVGDAVSIADCCLAPQLFAARRFGGDLSVAPTLTRIEAALMELPAFQAATPERQPDAPPPENAR